MGSEARRQLLRAALRRGQREGGPVDPSAIEALVRGSVLGGSGQSKKKILFNYF